MNEDGSAMESAVSDDYQAPPDESSSEEYNDPSDIASTLGVAEEEAATEATTTEATTATTKTEVVEEDEEYDLTSDAQPEVSELEQLRQEIAELKRQFSAQEGPQIIQFVDEETFAGMLSDHTVFNQVLNNLLQTALQGSMQTAQQIAVAEAVRAHTVFDATRKFYGVNKDLIPHQKVVQSVLQEMVQRKPDITLEELFDKGAKIVRKRLKLPEPGTAAGRTVSPFPSGGRAGAQLPKKPKPRQGEYDSKADLRATLGLE